MTQDLTIKTMAKAEILKPFILSWEGGYVNNKNDRGGATNKGVTISTWKKQGYDNDGDGDKDVKDLKMMTDPQWLTIFKKNYWDRWKADLIEDQSIANTLVDWVWGSGANGIKIPQQLLGVKPDGIVGAKTIAALNSKDPQAFFSMIQARRKIYFDRLIDNDPTQKIFYAGWMRRLNSLRYGGYVKNGDRKETKW